MYACLTASRLLLRLPICTAPGSPRSLLRQEAPRVLTASLIDGFNLVHSFTRWSSIKWLDSPVEHHLVKDWFEEEEAGGRASH
ncbi:hypothetical protein E2C01_004375 [Portunus trituberculatus]|uniref:Uncharacterized protein n=1 Tax=Portunus trituberculatus TaxID=210409 RepID=A0A5B7CW81_PORTR|nr:hypothetical protein [Portunus trituberculatus]